MERVGIKTAQLFIPMLRQDGAVFDDLMAEVTVGETYFFREIAHFTLLRETHPSHLSRARRKVRRFRAWSAAASTGEEPYSNCDRASGSGNCWRRFGHRHLTHATRRCPSRHISTVVISRRRPTDDRPLLHQAGGFVRISFRRSGAPSSFGISIWRPTRIRR
jgi:hypothetical protein